MSEKEKQLRFLPLLGGVFAAILSFIASIPISSSITLSFHIIESSGLYYFIWGIVEGGVIWNQFSPISAENIIPFVFWILLIFTSICGFVTTSYKENPSTMKKLLLLGGFIDLLILTYYTVIFFLNIGVYSLGYGFYGLILIAFLFFLSAGLLIDYQKM